MASKQDDFGVFRPPGKDPVVHNIFDFTAEALGQLRLYFEQNPPALPITSILGFQQFTAQAADPVSTEETTTSTTYDDLATDGPELTDLPDGKYIVLYGAAAKVDTAGGEVASMSIDVNGTGASDDNRCRTSSSFLTSIFTFAVVTLDAGGSNTITAKYKSSVGTTTASFADRKLVAIRYANP